MDAASGRTSQTRGAVRWRAAAIDAAALVLIALAVVGSHVALIRRGMGFDDPAACFHYGKRILDGAAPYRDFVYQAGPVPPYVDSLFQRWFGARYTASLDGAMAVTIVRVLVLWMIARRLAGVVAAALLAVWCALDPTFALPYDASASYAQLLVALAGLALLVAARRGEPQDGDGDGGSEPAGDARGERAIRIYLALGGASAGLVAAARPGAAAAIAIVLAIASLVPQARRACFSRPRLVALWGGFAAGLALVFGLLAIAGLLGPAVQQMIADPPAMHGLRIVPAVLDAISGGGVNALYRSWWGGLLVFAGLSLATVGTVLYLAARGRSGTGHTLAVLGFAALLLLGLYTRYAALEWLVDLPRVFLTVIAVLAVAAPARLRLWFGISPLVALALGALPLASDWAMQAALPGRDASDVPSLVTGALLVTLATRHLAPRGKTLLCGALAVAAVVHLAAAYRHHLVPFLDPQLADGTLSDNKLSSNRPVLRGILISEARRKAVDWLAAQVPPDSTCFIYGNVPVLYDVLGCRNPTQVDTIAIGELSTRDAEQAVAALHAQPPDVIIAHDRIPMIPPLLPRRSDQLELYGWFDPEPIRALHMGLHTLLDQYEQVGVVGDILGPALAARADASPDHINAIRVFRRTGKKPGS